ncbi:hypothetical protein M4D76_16210 [Peribacillus frigoritolerans]|uniref:hypothetical protein n=1 Tax=Peribacillus frigoritolerans TaxID=450367 RepID=UPI0021A8D5E3|nr:hypothetical protein [Peribacillus frigoritolerans]MCT1389840.1 hypothetical protein [Peribacillus frigoritolerans]
MHKASSPVCVHCDKELYDWKGNIMVDSDDFLKQHVVRGLQIWCFDCTNELNKEGYGKNYHHIWHLSRIQDGFFTLVEGVLDNSKNPDVVTKWEKQAVKDFFDLGSLRYQEKTIEWTDELQEYE